MWSSSGFSEALEEPQRVVLFNTISNIMSKLISGIQPPIDSETENFCTYCVLTLNQIFRSEAKLPCILLPLMDAIVNYFQGICEKKKINQDVAELFCTAEKRFQSDITVIRKIMHILVEKKKLTDAFYLASSFLCSGQYARLCSSKSLSLFLMPFEVLEDYVQPNFEEEIFLLSSNILFKTLVEEMNMKSQGISIIISSLMALSKLTSFMEKEAKECVIISLGVIFLPEPGENKRHFLSSLCLENRNISLALLELFSSFLSDEVYKDITGHGKLLLLKYFLRLLKNPSTDCNIVSEALRLLKSYTALNARHRYELDSEMKDELVAVICRKLFGNKETIVDSALHLTGEIMNGEDRDLWIEVVLKHSMHIIVWDIAIEGSHDGIIKASALNAISSACTQAPYFDSIKSLKDVSKVDIMNILCNFVLDDDFFIQRESLLCASKWMQLNHSILPPSCKTNLFLILSSATRSLDLDLKLAALKQWQLFKENENFFPLLSNDSINSCLTQYCSSGFGSSLLYALEDYDESVKYAAATIMLKLRRELDDNGITKDFIPEETITLEELPKQDLAESLSAISVIEEERNEGIDNVMELSTAEQILNICKMADSHSSHRTFTFPDLELESISCSVKSFWNSLWSDQINVILEPEVKSISVFSEYSLSLLDDIISAERTDIFNDTPDCY